jgi:hypothetical protein
MEAGVDANDPSSQRLSPRDGSGSGGGGGDGDGDGDGGAPRAARPQATARQQVRPPRRRRAATKPPLPRCPHKLLPAARAAALYDSLMAALAADWPGVRGLNLGAQWARAGQGARQATPPAAGCGRPRPRRTRLRALAGAGHARTGDGSRPARPAPPGSPRPQACARARRCCRAWRPTGCSLPRRACTRSRLPTAARPRRSQRGRAAQRGRSCSGCRWGLAWGGDAWGVLLVARRVCGTSVVAGSPPGPPRPRKRRLPPCASTRGGNAGAARHHRPRGAGGLCAPGSPWHQPQRRTACSGRRRGGQKGGVRPQQRRRWRRWYPAFGDERGRELSMLEACAARRRPRLGQQGARRWCGGGCGQRTWRPCPGGGAAWQPGQRLGTITWS